MSHSFFLVQKTAQTNTLNNWEKKNFYLTSFQIAVHFFSNITSMITHK
jgi:hypothetical protein